MKKAISAALCLCACVYNGPVNNEGFYSNADITKVDWSKVNGKGTACQTNWFFGLIPTGSNSLMSAIERGEIATLAYVDTDMVLYLPLLMTRDCTNAYGELTMTARKASAYDSTRGARTAASAKSAPAAEPASDYGFPAQSEN